MKYLIIILILCSSTINYGQQPPPDGGMGSGPKPPNDLMCRVFFPPELVMRNQLAIDLTSEQQTAIRSEMQKSLPHFTELQWELSAEEESLAKLLKVSKPDETQVLAQLDKLLAVEVNLKKVQLGMMLRIRNLLTPDQQEKLRQLKREDRPGGDQRPPPRDDRP
jgi:Spy/CpxP family protein refolding chaperone